MRYHSTRSKGEFKTFEEAVLSAYASDGGLYVPEMLPTLPENYRELWKSFSFPEICAEVLHLFSDIDVPTLRDLCFESYKDFNDGITHLPLHHVHDLYLLDTSLGPTLAFKDVGQQIMGKLINYLLAKRGQKGNIVVETSGDTGPAAIAGVKDSSHVNIFCLYPSGRVSEIQELQMITVDAPNVFVYRTEGNTDEQASVLKEIFADHEFLQKHNIFSVNSINIGRIIAQSSYFLWCSLQVSDETVGKGLTVVIPTGAFGNAMGAYMARLLGVNLKHIVCATNANDIVHRTIAYGDLRLDENRQTVSPAMDIQFAYNLERMLYYVSQGDCDRIRGIMTEVEMQYRSLSDHQLNKPPLSIDLVQAMQEIFYSYSVSDTDTLQTIHDFYEETLNNSVPYMGQTQPHGFVLCPHSATAVFVARHVLPRDQPRFLAEVGATVVVLTAHPDKFDATVTHALTHFTHSHEEKNDEQENGESPSKNAFTKYEIGPKVKALKSLPQKYRWLRKQDQQQDQSDDDHSWRQRWISILRNDIEEVNK